MVNHKGDVLVLASESKAHAAAGPKRRLAKPRTAPQPRPHTYSSPSDHSPRGHSRQFSHGSTPSPLQRPNKRVKRGEAQATQHGMSDAMRVPITQDKLSAATHQHPTTTGRTPPVLTAQQPAIPQAGPSRLGPPFAQQLGPRGVSPGLIPPYTELRGSSVPPPNVYRQSGFPPPMYPPPVQQIPGMYPSNTYPQMSTYPQMGQYWGQPPPWQHPGAMPTMSPEQYAEWFKSQGST